MMLGLSPEEEERRTNRLEHSKFLLYQVQQELSLYPANKDCVLQCEDGSYWTSLPNMASISALVRNTCQVKRKPIEDKMCQKLNFSLFKPSIHVSSNQ